MFSGSLDIELYNSVNTPTWVMDTMLNHTEGVQGFGDWVKGSADAPTTLTDSPLVGRQNLCSSVLL